MLYLLISAQLGIKNIISVPSYLSLGAKDADKLLFASFEIPNMPKLLERLKLFDFVLKCTECNWLKSSFSGDLGTKLANNICTHDEFIELCQRYLASDDLDYRANISISLNWILRIINMLQKVEPIMSAVKIFCSCFSSWNKLMRYIFIQCILKITKSPLIDAESLEFLVTFLGDQEHEALENDIAQPLIQLVLYDIVSVRKLLKNVYDQSNENVSLLDFTTLHSKAWELLDPLQISTADKEKFISGISHFRYIGALENPCIKNLNESLHLLQKEISKKFLLLTPNYTLDNNLLIKFYLFNEMEISKNAERQIIQITEVDDIDASIPKLLQTFGIEILSLIISEISLFKEKVKLGHIPLISSSNLLNLLKYTSVIVSDYKRFQNFGKHRFSFWVHCNVLCNFLIKNTFNWLSMNLYKQKDIEYLFSKVLKYFAFFIRLYKYALRCSPERDSPEFYKSWVEDGVASLEDWILIKNEKINEMSFEIVISLLQILKDQSLSLGIELFKTISSHISNLKVINQKQSSILKRMLWKDEHLQEPAIPEKRLNGSDIEIRKTQKISVDSSIPKKPHVVVEPDFFGGLCFSTSKSTILAPVSKVAPQIPSNRKVLSKSQNIFDRLKTETLMETRRNALKVQNIQRSKFGNDIPTVTNVEPEQPREKRSAVRIDLPNVNPSSSLRAIKIPSNPPVLKPLRSLNEFMDNILSWKITDKLPSVPGVEISKIISIPSNFKSSLEYFKCFEPILLLELRSQYLKACEMLKSQTCYPVVLEIIALVDKRKSNH